MLESLTNFPKSCVIPVLAASALIGCSKAGESSTRFTPVGGEQETWGTAVETKLTACGPEPGKSGTCEGTLVIKPPKPGATSVAVEVTRDVALKKAGQPAFLPQLRGSALVVKYRATKEGPNLATSVVEQ